MILTLILYGMMTLFTCSLAWLGSIAKNRGTRYVIYFFTALFPSVFSAVRHEVGTDFTTYAEYFSGNFYRSNFEWLFEVIVNLFQNITYNSFWYFLFFNLIMFLFALGGMQYYRERFKINIGLTMYVYMLVFYFISFNVLRQVVAASILLFATQFIFKKKVVLFIFYVILASGFHISSFLILPFYFYYWMDKNTKNKTLFGLIIVIAVIGIWNADVILSQLVNLNSDFIYYSGYFAQRNSGFSLFNRIVRSATYILIFNYIVNNANENKRELITLYLMYLISVLFSFASQIYVSDVISRLSISLEITLIPLISYSYKYFQYHKKIIFSLIILLYPMIEFLYDTFIKGYGEIVPYKFIF